MTTTTKKWFHGSTALGKKLSFLSSGHRYHHCNVFSLVLEEVWGSWYSEKNLGVPSLSFFLRWGVNGEEHEGELFCSGNEFSSSFALIVHWGEGNFLDSIASWYWLQNHNIKKKKSYS